MKKQNAQKWSYDSGKTLEYHKGVRKEVRLKQIGLQWCENTTSQLSVSLQWLETYDTEWNVQNGVELRWTVYNVVKLLEKAVCQ